MRNYKRKSLSLLTTLLMLTTFFVPLKAFATDIIIRSSSTEAQFSTIGTWSLNTTVKLDDATTGNYISSSTTAASAIFKPTALNPGKYWVWFFSPRSTSNNEDTAVTIKIANGDSSDGGTHTPYQTDLTVNQNTAVSNVGGWIRISTEPITFSGNGSDFVKVIRGSTLATRFTRVGTVKFTPVTDELVLENTNHTVGLAKTDPYFELTGTWATSSSLKLYNDIFKQYTVSSNATSAASAKFKAVGLKAGAYKVWFFNPKGGTDDTNATFKIYQNGNTISGITLNQTLYNNTWVQLVPNPVVFSGDGSEYVELNRTTTSTSQYTRVGAIKFEPLPASEVGLSSLSVKSNGVDIPLGGYRDTKLTYNAYIPINQTSATINIATIHPLAQITVNGQPATSGVDFAVTGIEKGIKKTVSVVITAPDLTTKTITMNFETAVIVDNDIAGSGYVESGTFANPSQPAVDYLDTNTGSATRISAAANNGSTALWTPAQGKLEAGKYEAFIWRPVNSTSKDASDSTKIEILANGVTTTKVVNLRGDDATWVSLGKYNFVGSGAESIKAFKTDGVNLRTDAVKFVPYINTVSADNADLEALSLKDNNGLIKPVTLINGTTSYTVETYNISTVQINALSLNQSATVKINGQTVDTNGDSSVIPISKQSMRINVVVTSEDTLTNKTYVIHLNNYLVLDDKYKGYTETGIWSDAGDRFGLDSRGVRKTTEQGATAKWSIANADITPGKYVVETLCVVKSNDTTKDIITYSLNHNAETASKIVDYNTAPPAGTWISLGTLDFTGDGSEYITFTKTSDASISTYADTTRLIAYNEPPVVLDRNYYIKTTDSSITKTYTTTDSESSQLAYALNTQPTKGVLSNVADTGNGLSFTYTPNQGATTGVDVFKVIVTDELGGFSISNVYILRAESGVVVNKLLFEEEQLGSFVATSSIIQNGTYRFSFNTTSLGLSGNKDVFALVGQYNKTSGKLESVSIQTVNVLLDVQDATVHTSSFNVTDYQNTTYKLMVFDGLDSIKPLITTLVK